MSNVPRMAERVLRQYQWETFTRNKFLSVIKSVTLILIATEVLLYIAFPSSDFARLGVMGWFFGMYGLGIGVVLLIYTSRQQRQRLVRGMLRWAVGPVAMVAAVGLALYCLAWLIAALVVPSASTQVRW